MRPDDLGLTAVADRLVYTGQTSDRVFSMSRLTAATKAEKQRRRGWRRVLTNPLDRDVGASLKCRWPEVPGYGIRGPITLAEPPATLPRTGLLAPVSPEVQPSDNFSVACHRLRKAMRIEWRRAAAPSVTSKRLPLLVPLSPRLRGFGRRMTRTKRWGASSRTRPSDSPSTPRHAACRTPGARSDWGW